MCMQHQNRNNEKKSSGGPSLAVYAVLRGYDYGNPQACTAGVAVVSRINLYVYVLVYLYTVFSIVVIRGGSLQLLPCAAAGCGSRLH